LILNGGWSYDLQQWFLDKFLFRGKMQELRQRTIHMADLQPGDIVLDVGCGTGTLAIEAQQYVGVAGHVAGIDPGTQQIARARSKAARRYLPVDFQIGVIGHLPFPDASFDVVLSTIMMHHLSDRLKREGLAEITRVLKPGGRLVVADFKRSETRSQQLQKKSVRFGSVRDLPELIKEAGFLHLRTDEMEFPQSHADVSFVSARKS